MTKVKVEYEPTDKFYRYNIRIRIWGDGGDYTDVELRYAELELLKDGKPQ